MKNILTLLGLVCLSVQTNGQSLYDALRYSQTNYSTNARSLSVGSAFGALGGNSISSSINPAGIGLHPTSEFGFSLGLLNANTSSTYLGNTTDDEKYALNIPNLAVSFTEFETDFGKPVTEGWISHSFAMNLNRSNSFGANVLFQGINANNGMVNFMAQDATNRWNSGYNLDSSSYGGMGYFGYLIDPVYDTDSSVIAYQPSVGNQDDIKYDQLQTLATRGNTTDMNFGWAGNYSNKLYIGVNLGVPILNYREEGTYQETNLYGGEDNYNYMEMQHSLTDNGIGINLSAGVIYKPVQFLRLGLSAKTPTFYSITREYKVSLYTDTDAGGIREIQPGSNETKYRMITPYTFTASAAAIILKSGFISIDYALTDPSTARMRAAGLDGSAQYFNVNQNIRNNLSATQQLRVGAEWMFGPFSVRGGYSHTNSPFNDLLNPETGPYSLESYSGGVGYRENNYFVDFGFQTSNSSDYFEPYTLENEITPGSNNKKNMTTFMASVGFKF